jgi:hypothetical protein
VKRSYLRDRRGSAAVEFAFWLGALVFPTLGALDVGFYVYQSMQVREAAQAAAQTVFALCDGQISGFAPPMTTNCTNLQSRIGTAVQSTSLGSGVSWTTLAEGWYCVGYANSSLNLTASGTTVTVTNGGGTAGSMSSTAPSCANGNTAGDYITITTTYSYKPVFPGMSVISLLGGATITKSGLMRVY